jgi:hypothetical protein
LRKSAISSLENTATPQPSTAQHIDELSALAHTAFSQPPSDQEPHIEQPS